MNNKSKIYILVLIWVAALLQLVINASIDREEKMVEQVLSQDVTNLTEGVVKAYGFYGNDELTQQGRELIVTRLAKQLGITSGYDITNKFTNANETTSLVKQGEKADTEVKLITLANDTANEDASTENYILIQITLKQDAASTAYGFKERIVEIYNNLGISPSTNLYLCSQIKGELTEYEINRQTEEFLNQMDAKEVSTDTFDNVTCVYGYSRNIDEFVYQNENRVNVNIAFSYDEAEDITYVHRAVPFVDRSF